MKHIKNFNENLNEDDADDALEYLKLCFIDMSDEYGIYDESAHDNDGVSITYSIDDELFMIVSSSIWVNGINYSDKRSSINLKFDNIDASIEYAELFLKVSKDIQDGLKKFSIKYKFKYTVLLGDYLEVNIFDVEEK